MSDHTVRLLGSEEHRAAGELFGATLHKSPSQVEQANSVEGAVQPGRVFGAFDDELIGTVRSSDSGLVGPDGTLLSNAAVTGVGVRPDRTRRGVLRELLRAQLRDFAERGVVTANLHATEGAIYGRFGYGPATYSCRYRVNRHRTVFRDDLPPSGAVDRVDMVAARARFPDIYAALSEDRPGLLRRSTFNWAGLWHFLSRSDTRLVTIVHHGVSGVDGFAAYDVQHRENRTELTVYDMHVGTVGAFVGIWCYLHGVDLVDEIVLPDRPMDEPADLLFTDPRGFRVGDVGDETWLRLVDVPAALSAIPRDDAMPLILEVTDELLPGNTGRYRLSPDAVEPTDRAADLRMDVGTLAMVYLGAWRPSVLASFGRIGYTEPTVLPEADRLFHTAHVPWCGTHF